MTDGLTLSFRFRILREAFLICEKCKNRHMGYCVTRLLILRDLMSPNVLRLNWHRDKNVTNKNFQ